MVTHEWPRHIDLFGHLPNLLRRNPDFAMRIRRGELGSLLLWGLLKELKPKYWFCSHEDAFFDAVVNHLRYTGDGEIAKVAELLEKEDILRMKRKKAISTGEVEENVDLYMDDPYLLGAAELLARQEEITNSKDLRLPPKPSSNSLGLPNINLTAGARNMRKRFRHKLNKPLPPPPIPPKAMKGQIEREAREKLEEERRKRDDGIERPPAPNQPPIETRFHAFDRVGGKGPGSKQHWYQVFTIDIPMANKPDKPILTYDPEWLAITKAFHEDFSTGEEMPKWTTDPYVAERRVAEARIWVRDNIGDGDWFGTKELTSVQKFERVQPDAPEGQGPSSLEKQCT